MNATAGSGARAIPERACLLHIGAPKTATTAIQNASRHQRAALLEAGVCYPGRGLNHARATSALLGESGMKTARAGHESHLEQVLDELAATTAPRRFLSNELMAGADDSTVEAIVDAFGPNVHVVITLRGFCEMIPSIWQQYVKERKHIPFDEWLERKFGVDPDDAVTPSFWRRHDVGALVDRWAGATSPDRVTVAMLDPGDSRSVFRVFEGLLALPDGFFHPRASDGFASNRSLTSAEIELVRAVNAELAGTDTSLEDYRDFMRFGMIGGIQRRRYPPGSERRTALPEWAVERAVEAATRGVERVRRSGVHVIGDLDHYAARPAIVGAVPPPEDVDLDLAAEAVAGILSKAVGAGVGFERARKRGVAPRTRVDSDDRDVAGRAAVGVDDAATAPMVLVAASDEHASALERSWGSLEASSGRRGRSTVLVRVPDDVAREVAVCSTAPRPPLLDPDLLARVARVRRDRTVVLAGPSLFHLDPSDVATLSRAVARPMEVVVFSPSPASAVSHAWEIALVTGTTMPYSTWARRARRAAAPPRLGAVSNTRREARRWARVGAADGVARTTVIASDATPEDVRDVLAAIDPRDALLPTPPAAPATRIGSTLEGLLRAVGRTAEGRGIDLAFQARVVGGVAERLRHAPACETEVSLSLLDRWALRRDGMAAKRILARSGVGVVGSPRPPRAPSARLFRARRSASAPASVSIDVAVAACTAAYDAAIRARGDSAGEVYPVRVLVEHPARVRVRAAVPRPLRRLGRRVASRRGSS